MYIFNSNVKNNQIMSISLTRILGIGTYTSKLICNMFGMGKAYTINTIGLKHLNDISNYINNKLLIDSNLLKYYYLNLKKYVDLKNYRGLRHRMGYTVRGQRTHSNGKTQKRLYKRIFMFKYK